MKLDTLYQHIKKMSKIQKVSYFVTFVYILSILPLLYIGRYNHMTYDDYAFGAFAHKAWQESSSILQAINAAFDYTKWVFNHWQGTYSSVFLMSLQPGVFSEKLYYITPLIFIPMLSWGVYMLVSSINKYLFKGEKYSGRIVALFLMVICIQRVDTPVDSFYWFNGSVHYTLFQSLVLIIISWELKLLFEDDTKKKKRALVGAVILSCFTGGSNYISSFFVVLISLTILGVFYLVKRKISGSLLLVLGIQLITLLINITAPGNQYRADRFSVERSAFTAIMQSFTKCFEDVSNWLDLPLLIAVVLLIPVILYMFRDTEFTFPFPGLVALYSICLLASMRTPTYYAMGNEGPSRASNIVQYMFYIFFVLNCCYMTGHVQAKLIELRDSNTCKLYLKNAEKYIVVAAAILIFVVSCDDYNEYTTLSAIASLYYNEAQLYHVECCEREKLLKDDTTNGQKVEVKFLQFKPKVLFHADITSTETDSENTAMAGYYDKSAVIGVP